MDSTQNKQLTEQEIDDLLPHEMQETNIDPECTTGCSQSCTESCSNGCSKEKRA